MTGALSQAMAALRVAAPNGFFVGGCVRDWLLERDLKDLDIVGPDPVHATGRELASALGGAFFWLREEMGVGRVILRSEPLVQIDLVPLAGSLEDDLRRRDFTVNAMAVSVKEGLVAGAPVIDPTGGRADLERRLLCLAAADALERDPLRCLRAFRLRSRLGLSFAPGLECALTIAAPLLSQVSGERIRDELFVLLEADQSAPVVAELVRRNLVQPWSAVLAQSAAGGDSRLASPVAETPGEAAAVGTSSGLELLGVLDQLLLSPPLPDRCAADLAEALSTPVTPPRTRRALARLAALSIGAGAATAAVGHSLCLSEDESRVLTRAVAGAMALADSLPAAGSDRLRFFRRWEPGAVEAALLALAAASGGHAPIRSGKRAARNGLMVGLLDDALERRLRPAPPLLSGKDVMTVCRLTPGPEVGRWLRAVEEQRADGRLRSTEEARAWLQAQCGPELPRGES